MSSEEFAGKIDFVVFVLTVVGSLYFFVSGYPLYLGEMFPILKEIWVRITASAFIALGMVYIFVVAVASFFRSVRRIEAVFETGEESGKGSQ